MNKEVFQQICWKPRGSQAKQDNLGFVGFNPFILFLSDLISLYACGCLYVKT